MLRNRALRVPFWLGLVVLTSSLALSQDAVAANVHPYHGPMTHVEGVFVTHVNRAEPEASLFQVPPDYKIVDETPNTK
jgi:hypothetical protein